MTVVLAPKVLTVDVMLTGVVRLLDSSLVFGVHEARLCDVEFISAPVVLDFPNAVYTWLELEIVLVSFNRLELIDVIVDERCCPLRVLKLCTLIVKELISSPDLVRIYVIERFPGALVLMTVLVACAGMG